MHVDTKKLSPRIPINGTLKESISIEVLFLFDLFTIWRHAGSSADTELMSEVTTSRKFRSIWHLQHPTHNCGGYVWRWQSILSININQTVHLLISRYFSFSFSCFLMQKSRTQTNRQNDPFWRFCTRNNRIYFPPLFFLQTEPLLSVAKLPSSSILLFFPGEPPSVAHRSTTSTLAL